MFRTIVKASYVLSKALFVSLSALSMFFWIGLFFLFLLGDALLFQYGRLSLFLQKVFKMIFKRFSQKNVIYSYNLFLYSVLKGGKYLPIDKGVGKNLPIDREG